jgi:photosystem II stability/assembly factor-like uncharacterized protein
MGCEARLDLSGVDETLDKPIRRTDQLMSIEQTQDGTTIIFGDNGLVLTSESGYDNWQRKQLGPDGKHPNFIDSSLCQDGRLVALAYQGEVWSTEDKGASWSSNTLPTGEEMQSIECTPSGDIWVVGSFSTMLLSKDKGMNWVESSMQEDSMLTSITFINATQGYAIGEFGLLLRTDNAGESWEILDPIGEDFYPLTAYFKDLETGWVGGLQGVIMATNDGGLTWHRQSAATDVPIYNFIQNGSLYATGDRGTVLKLQGDSWEKVITPEIPTYYRSGIVTGDNSLLIAGGWGVLLPLDLSVNKN